MADNLQPSEMQQHASSSSEEESEESDKEQKTFFSVSLRYKRRGCDTEEIKSIIVDRDKAQKWRFLFQKTEKVKALGQRLQDVNANLLPLGESSEPKIQSVKSVKSYKSWEKSVRRTIDEVAEDICIRTIEVKPKFANVVKGLVDVSCQVFQDREAVCYSVTFGEKTFLYTVSDSRLIEEASSLVTENAVLIKALPHLVVKDGGSNTNLADDLVSKIPDTIISVSDNKQFFSATTGIGARPKTKESGIQEQTWRLERSKEKVAAVSTADICTENYLYIHGINPGTSREGLTIYIEHRASEDVIELIFNSGDDKALAKLSNMPGGVSNVFFMFEDIHWLKERVEQRPLEHSKLQVSIVNQPKAIVVSSDRPLESMYSLILFFESKQHGGWLLAHDDVKETDDGCYILHFKEREAVKRICSKSQYHFQNRVLNVSPFYSCPLGSIWDTSCHKVDFTQDRLVSLAKEIYSFMSGSPKVQGELKRRLAPVNTEVTFQDEYLVLSCTLDPGSPKSRTWPKDAENVLDEYMKNIEMKTIHVDNQQIWIEIKKSLSSESLQASEILLLPDQREKRLCITGFTKQVHNLFKKISSEIDKLQHSLKRTEEKQHLPVLAKGKILHLAGILAKIQKQRFDLSIDFNESGGDMVYKGEPGEIHAAKLQVCEELDKIESMYFPHSYTATFSNFMGQTCVVKEVNDRITADGLIGDWEVTEKDIVVYALGKDEATALHKVVTDSIRVTNRAVLEDELPSVQSAVWVSFTSECVSEYGEKYVITVSNGRKPEITLMALHDIYDQLMEKVNTFLEEHAIKMDEVVLSDSDIDIDTEDWDSFETEVEQKYSEQFVKLKKQGKRFVVKGTKDGLERTKTDIKEKLELLIEIQRSSNIDVDKPEPDNLSMEKRIVRGKVSGIGTSIPTVSQTDHAMDISMPEAVHEGREIVMKGTTEDKAFIQQKLEEVKDWKKEEISLTAAEQGKVDDAFVKQWRSQHHDVHISRSENGAQMSLIGPSQSVDKANHKLYIHLGRIKVTGRYRGHRKFDKIESLGEKDEENSTKSSQNRVREDLSGGGGHSPSFVKPMSFFTDEGIEVKVYLGDIVTLPVDCIVNAANSSLMHGGGVARAIAKAGGREFDKESREYLKQHGKIDVTECCVTGAGNMRYKCVIHAVGPQWSHYKDKMDCLHDLKKTVLNSLLMAERRGMQSIAIPPISAGIFGVPQDLCAQQYAQGVLEFSKKAKLQEIHFVARLPDLCSIIQSGFKEALDPRNGAGAQDNVPSGKSRPGLGSQEGAEPSTTSHDGAQQHSSIVEDYTALATVISSPSSTCVPKCFGRYFEQKEAEQKRVWELAQQAGRRKEKEHENQYQSELRVSKAYSQPQHTHTEAQFSNLYLRLPELEIDEAKVKHPNTSPNRATGNTGGRLYPCLPYKPTYAEELASASSSSQQESSASSASDPNRTVRSGDQLHGAKGELFVFHPLPAVNVFIYTQDITTVHVDAIVCPDDQTLAGEGVIARSVKRICGVNYTQTVYPKVRDKKPALTETVVTEPGVPSGNVGFKYIIHVVTPKLQSSESNKGSHTFKKNVKRCVENVLHVANKRLLQSIAIPVLGIGNKDTTIECCDAMAEGVLHFLADSTQNPLGLKQIHIVAFEKGLVYMLKETFALNLDNIPDQNTIPTPTYITGNQPEGTMISYKWKAPLEGYPECGHIEISYDIPSRRDPLSGRYVFGTRESAYLPDNEEGNKVLKLLGVAFSRKLVFTIGPTKYPNSNQVVWTGILHMTKKSGGSRVYGYPNPEYLKVVQQQLAAFGITGDQIQ